MTGFYHVVSIDDNMYKMRPRIDLERIAPQNLSDFRVKRTFDLFSIWIIVPSRFWFSAV